MTDVLGKAEVTPPKKPWSNKAKTALVAGVSIVAAVLIYRAVKVVDQNRLDFDTGCVQTAPTGSTFGALPQTYTGTQALWRWQWGFISVNWGTMHTASWHNGLGKQMTPFCPPAVNIVGDCWQSVSSFAATPGTPKWLVADNVASMCTQRGAQVWKFESGNWRFKSMIPANIKTPNAQITLDGDYAYALQNTGGLPRFVKFDLNALTVAATDLTSRPAYVPQATLPDGKQLRMFADHPTPLPQPYPGPHKFHVVVEGGSTPPTPGLSPTPVADPLAAWDEELAREGITAGCGAGKFCPEEPLTREQGAVWVLKAKHGSSYVPPPCQGMFVDVPCAPAGGTQ